MLPSETLRFIADADKSLLQVSGDQLNGVSQRSAEKALLVGIAGEAADNLRAVQFAEYFRTTVAKFHEAMLQIAEHDDNLIGKTEEFVQVADHKIRPFLALIEKTAPKLIDGPISRDEKNLRTIYARMVAEFSRNAAMAIKRNEKDRTSVTKYEFNNPTITNSQIGDHNTQNIVNALASVIHQIECGAGDQAQKQEAKSRLRAFLEHPLTSAVVGGAVGGLIEKLK